MKCPSHIETYVVEAGNRFPTKADDSHFYYQVKCSCGSEWFQVQKSDKPAVSALCRACQTIVTVYDISQYPAGTPNPTPSGYIEIQHPNDGNILKVFVMFEYGELDVDQEFDQNDISWCQVFVEDKSGRMAKVLDDETA